MIESYVVIVVLYALICYSYSTNKKMINKRDHIVYLLFMLASFYLSMDMVLNNDFPDLNDLGVYLFDDLGKIITSILKHPS